MRVPVWAWIVWALLGIGLELLALSNVDAGDTLTDTIVKLIPGWLLFMFLGWAAWHFTAAYRSRRR